MKKILLVLSMLPGMVYADSIPTAADYVTRTGSISTNAAVLYGTDGNLLRPVAVSASGAIGNGATSGLIATGMTAYTALSYSATTVNLTTSAGASVPCMVCLSSNGGAAAGFKIQFTTSATAPVALTSSSQGHYIAASTTAQCWGPMAAGTILHAAGVAASSSVLVDVQKVQ